jgi:flagellar protein FliS
MVNASRAAALRYYRDSGAAAAACDASPHRLITMLYDGVIERLGRGASALSSNDLAGKVRAVNSAMEMITYLRAILDFNAGGDIARQFDALYDYMLRRLTQANAANDPKGLHEVMQLVSTVKSGWEQIPEPLHSK